MKDFAHIEYIGLFLTKESKDRLKNWLMNIAPIEALGDVDWENPTEYLDHCTLIHRSQMDKAFDLDTFMETVNTLWKEDNKIQITHIGHNGKALAFKVDSPLVRKMCKNENPHITICTYNGGKPKDSNTITNWVELMPITIEVEARVRLRL